MTLRSHSRAGLSEVTSAKIHPEKLVCAARTEPEMARPEVEFTPVASSSPDRGISITTDTPALDNCGEAVEVLSEGSFPGRISNRHIQRNPFSITPSAATRFYTGPKAHTSFVIINRCQRKTENNNDGKLEKKLKGKAIEHTLSVEDLILNACYLVVHDMSVLNVK